MAMKIYREKAEEICREGNNCCQSVLLTLCEQYGIDRHTAMRFGAVFGSGIGLSGETCGAITGSMMLIGLATGIFSQEELGENTTEIFRDGRRFEIHERPDAYDMAQEFHRRFRQRFGGKFRCKDLLGADVGTAEGHQYVLDHDLFAIKCRQFIVEGADIISDILHEKGLLAK